MATGDVTSETGCFPRGSVPGEVCDWCGKGEARWLMSWLGEYVCDICREAVRVRDAREVRAEVKLEAARNTARARDTVNPAHYRDGPFRCGSCGNPIECIDITQHMSFSIGNVIKYLWRFGRKANAPPLEDLRKARWYLDREITRLGEEGRDGPDETI